MSENDKKIYFAPVPGVDGGQTMLSIYPPGTWFHDPNFVCFVGGCGIGHAATLVEAKKILLTGAKAYCLRVSKKAKEQAAHYDTQLDRLAANGLGPKVPHARK